MNTPTDAPTTALRWCVAYGLTRRSEQRIIGVQSVMLENDVHSVRPKAFRQDTWSRQWKSVGLRFGAQAGCRRCMPVSVVVRVAAVAGLMFMHAGLSPSAVFGEESGPPGKPDPAALRTSLQRTQYSAAWETLLAASSASSERVGAATFLYSQGEQLGGIDLSCGTLGGNWDEQERTCNRKNFTRWLPWGTKSGGANLGGAALARIYLEGADLRGADLGNATLFGANFQNANLSGVNLSSADLTGADLRTADLSGAHLDRADLSGADLRGADLRRAILSVANVSRVKISDVNYSVWSEDSLPPFACKGEVPAGWGNILPIVIVESDEALLDAYEGAIAAIVDNATLVERIEARPWLSRLTKWDGGEEVDVKPCARGSQTIQLTVGGAIPAPFLTK